MKLITHKFYKIIFCVLLLTPTISLANTPITFTPFKIDPKDFKFSGYFDVSYNYLVNTNHFVSDTHDRSFDLNENGFTLQQIYLNFTLLPQQGFGGALTAFFGRDAFTITPFGYNPDTGIHNFGQTLEQLFAQYAYGPFKTIVGLFETLVGVESNVTSTNFNYSLSFISAYAIPGTFLGVRQVYAVNDKLTLTFGINNGWDIIRDTGRDKTVALGLLYAGPVVSVNVVAYSGQQRAQDGVASGPKGTRNLIDASGLFNVTKKLSFAFELTYGNQSTALLADGNYGNAMWEGVAGYINYHFNDAWRISIRAEDFNDNDGSRTGVAQNLKEATLTLGFSPIKNLELRAETRHDFSSAHSIVAKNGTLNNLKGFNQSYALEAVYTFA